MSVTGGIMAGTSLLSGWMGSNAANKAAQQQEQGLQQAMQEQRADGNNAINYEQNMYGNEKQNLSPYMNAGTGALSNLQYLMGEGGTAPGGSNAGYGSLLQPYSGGQFTAPTLQQAQQMPGYQFQLQQGNQALQQSAAARGNLLTGGTAEALNNFSQGVAQSNYGNLYNQALNTYQTNYNNWNQQNTNTYNRLSGIANAGQTAATNLSNLGQQNANAVSGDYMGMGQEIGNDLTGIGNAQAGGTINSANAWGGALSNMGNGLSQLKMLQSMKNAFGGNYAQGVGSGYTQALYNIGNSAGPVDVTNDPITGFLG